MIERLWRWDAEKLRVMTSVSRLAEGGAKSATYFLHLDGPPDVQSLLSLVKVGLDALSIVKPAGLHLGC